ncbi:hypothetical protein BpHYR1_052240, partial [Brachionus plicatilis]
MEYFYSDDYVCECCCYSDSLGSNEDQIYYLCDYTKSDMFKYQIDFYNYVEDCLSLKSSFVDHDLLTIDLIRCQPITFNENRLLKTLQMIQDNQCADCTLKLNLVKGLFCWHSQFNNISLIKLIAKFNEEHLKTEETTLGDLPNTLLFCIHSRSLEMVKLVVENFGASLDLSAFKYTIIENQPDILNYLLNKSTSNLKFDLIELLIDIAVKESKINCLKILLENSLKFKITIKMEKLKNCCQYLSLNLPSTCHQLELKHDLYSVLLNQFGVDLSSEASMGNESLFSVCFEFFQQNFCILFINSLKKRVDDSSKIDLILIDTLIVKMKRSFQSDIKLIEILLNYINNKKLLYKKLLCYESAKLLKPCDDQMKNIKLEYQGLSPNICNAYFLKHWLLVKYDVVPSNHRGTWIANYIFYWTKKCSNRSSYLSAANILRYLTSDEMADLVISYVKKLIQHGLMDSGTKSSLAWWSKLKQKPKMNTLDANTKDRIESVLLSLHECGKKKPKSLRLIARNQVREKMRSLSIESLASLQI